MLQSLRLSFRFLDSVYHGRGDGGEPEWPPSPLRVFQALVAAAASRWHADIFKECALPALEWFQSRLPEIVAPDTRSADRAYRLYVPNNAADLVASAWKRGNAGASIAEHRTEKDVRPTHLAGKTIHYLYLLPETRTADEDQFLTRLSAAARSVTHLGWGVDMVAADARVVTEAEADKLPGHRWRVVESGGVPLRVPTVGTLADLTRKHEAFLGRLSADGFRPVPPLQCFQVKQYHSATAGAGASPVRPMAAFEIHRTLDDQEQHPGKSRFRAFHHVRKVATVAGMVRHAAAAAARQMGKDVEWVNAHVLGHDDTKQGQASTDQRLTFLPLPSLQPVVGVGGIRRVLVVGWPGGEKELAELRRVLNGAELIDRETCQPAAVLHQLATTDKEVKKFTEPATTWTTVTPVLLPGHDDPDGLRRKLKEQDGKDADEQKRLLEKLDTRVLALLWKAFHQAGWTADALAGAELEYRAVGWLRGLAPAQEYDLPPLKWPRYHVWVRFPRAVRGPLAVGAGRYRGFGLFVADT